MENDPWEKNQAHGLQRIYIYIYVYIFEKKIP